MSDQHVFVKFEYNIRFTKEGSKYSLNHYNQWSDNDEKTFDDIRVMFEGKDLKGTELPNYKVVAWENLEDAKYDAKIAMVLYEDRDKNIQQKFSLTTLEKDNETQG